MTLRRWRRRGAIRLALSETLPGPVALDEIQKAAELFPAIKLAVDRNRQPGRFILTGSANVLMLPRLAESLAGRMEIIPLFPFSCGELARVTETFVRRLFAGEINEGKQKPAGLTVVERVVRGGHPTPSSAKYPRQGVRPGSLLTFQLLLQRDVRDLARVDALQCAAESFEATRGSHQRIIQSVRCRS